MHCPPSTLLWQGGTQPALPAPLPLKSSHAHTPARTHAPPPQPPPTCPPTCKQPAAAAAAPHLHFSTVSPSMPTRGTSRGPHTSACSIWGLAFGADASPRTSFVWRLEAACLQKRATEGHIHTLHSWRARGCARRLGDACLHTHTRARTCRRAGRDTSQVTEQHVLLPVAPGC